MFSCSVSLNSFSSINRKIVKLTVKVIGSATALSHNTKSMESYSISPKENCVSKSEDEWKQLLSPAEYSVIRGKGTEAPYVGEYDDFYPTSGYFACRACGQSLYSASFKFKSGCGWPAFDKFYQKSIKTEIDRSDGRPRTEILCAKCGGHLGHAFNGEKFTSTDERHCVNSVSIRYVKEAPDASLKETTLNQSSDH